MQRPRWLRGALSASPGLAIRASALTVGVVGWLYYAVISAAALIAELQREAPQLAWQYDWHVYLGGARSLVDQSLYRVPLSLDTYPLPVDVFNQTPLAALWALPLSAFTVEAGGGVWLGFMLVSIAGGMIFAAAALGLPRPGALAGIGLLAYSLSPWFTGDVLLGNINGLMFLLVAAFAWVHLQSKDRAAGLILGVAIATKPWPLAFLVLLARERGWREIRWVAAVLAVQGILFLAWLGVDVLPHLATAVTSPVPIEPRVTVFGWSLMRETYGMPDWVGYAVGLLLLALPAHGRLGLGIAILASLTLMVPNLWAHYLPVIALGLALIMIPLTERVRMAFLPGGHGLPSDGPLARS